MAKRRAAHSKAGTQARVQASGQGRAGQGRAHLMKVFSWEQHSMTMVHSSISWPAGMPCTQGEGTRTHNGGRRERSGPVATRAHLAPGGSLPPPELPPAPHPPPSSSPS
jgi:hypothetical protein